MSQTPESQHAARLTAVIASIEKLTKARLCTKADLGRIILDNPDASAQIASATTINHLKGRPLNDDKLAAVEAFLRKKMKALKAMLA